MAKAKVTHSDDAVQITFKGNPKSPEPSTGVIEFPGGHVEVSRCSDNTYWVHVGFVNGSNIVQGRIDRLNRTDAVEDLPDAKDVIKIAVRVQNKVPHFDPS
jgi:hypothetical protein